jgi:two-component system, OmpR family, phosphate regulon response regulator PhoB
MNQTRRENGPTGQSSAARILVVEDESDLALLLACNLEAEGYVVETVERGG